MDHTLSVVTFFFLTPIVIVLLHSLCDLKNIYIFIYFTFGCADSFVLDFPDGSVVKNPPVMQEM